MEVVELISVLTNYALNHCGIVNSFLSDFEDSLDSYCWTIIHIIGKRHFEPTLYRAYC